MDFFYSSVRNNFLGYSGGKSVSDSAILRGSGPDGVPLENIQDIATEEKWEFVGTILCLYLLMAQFKSNLLSKVLHFYLSRSRQFAALRVIFAPIRIKLHSAGTHPR